MTFLSSFNWRIIIFRIWMYFTTMTLHRYFIKNYITVQNVWNLVITHIYISFHSPIPVHFMTSSYYFWDIKIKQCRILLISLRQRHIVLCKRERSNQLNDISIYYLLKNWLMEYGRLFRILSRLMFFQFRR